MRHLPKCLTAAIVCLLLPSLCLAQATGYDPFQPGGDAARKPGVGTIASSEFVDTPLTSIFRLVSDLTGWSILLSAEVSKQPPKISLFIKNMPPEVVLQQVADLSGLVLRRQGNTFHVMTFDEYAQLTGVEKRVRQLHYARAEDAVATIKPFLDQSPDARVVASPSTNQVVLLLPPVLLTSVERLLDLIDAPFESEAIHVYRLRYLSCATVVTSLREFLLGEGARVDAARATAPFSPTTVPALDAPAQNLLLKLMPEPSLNAVILRGLPADVRRAVALLDQLDAAPDTQAVGYPLTYIDADEAHAAIQQILTERAATPLSREPERSAVATLRLSVSAQNNRLLAVGSPQAHRFLAEILQALDQPLPDGSGDVRVYRLENSSADQVLAVVQSLLQNDDAPSRAASPLSAARPAPDIPERLRPILPPTPPPAPGLAPPSGSSAPASDSAGSPLPARVTAAPEINALIVQASAAQHAAFATIIKQLDRPREQVLIEATLVTVTTTRTFDLTVELSATHSGDHGGGAIGLTSFGVGAVNSSTGGIRLPTPAPFGLSAAVFNAGDYSVLLNALQTVGDTRIEAGPKILIEDNAEGFISQLTEEPYEAVSQGESSTITSFGGFVEAGTVLTVTPHIAQDDWLRLEYEVTLSSFRQRTNQQLAANLPPPRAQNTSHGVVRVPAEHMVILGGLLTSRESSSVASPPLIGDIPLIGELFKSRSRDSENSTLFIFLRPVILRDPSFRDLLALTQQELDTAKIRRSRTPENPLQLMPGSPAP